MLIEFWATWALSSSHEKVLTDKLIKEKESLKSNVRIIRLAVDSDFEAVRKSIKDHGMEHVENFNVSDHDNCDVVEHLGGENGMIPYSVLVD